MPALRSNPRPHVSCPLRDVQPALLRVALAGRGVRPAPDLVSSTRTSLSAASARSAARRRGPCQPRPSRRWTPARRSSASPCMRTSVGLIRASSRATGVRSTSSRPLRSRPVRSRAVLSRAMDLGRAVHEAPWGRTSLRRVRATTCPRVGPAPGSTASSSRGPADRGGAPRPCAGGDSPPATRGHPNGAERRPRLQARVPRRCPGPPQLWLRSATAPTLQEPARSPVAGGSGL